MRTNKLSLLLFAILFFNTVKSQTTSNLPSTIEGTIERFNSIFSEKLKDDIKVKKLGELEDIFYPNTNDKTIENWQDYEDSSILIFNYLKANGIKKLKVETLLFAYKLFLENKEFTTQNIFEPVISLEKKWAFEDSNRYTVDTFRFEYIPKNLEDCFVQINSFWHDSTKNKRKLMNEGDFSSRLHMGFGMWMRNNWQLWGGSRLSEYFNNLGIYHPDDMSGIIITSYHRTLNNKPIQLEKQIQGYKDYWLVVKSPIDDSIPKKVLKQVNHLKTISGYNYEKLNKKPGYLHIYYDEKKNNYWLYDYYEGWLKTDFNGTEKVRKTENLDEQKIKKLYISLKN